MVKYSCSDDWMDWAGDRRVAVLFVSNKLFHQEKGTPAQGY